MIPLYYGFDPRESIGAHVWQHSVLTRASEPVSFTPLHLDTLKAHYKETHKGTNAFIHSRFLVPYLNGFQGWAIFADGADMLCLGDIAELWNLRDHYHAVMVVNRPDYTPPAPRKYVGTAMEADQIPYHMKNFSSLMLINCSHYAWRLMTPGAVMGMNGLDLHQFKWMDPERIGGLPSEWNHIVGVDSPRNDAKIVHFSDGIPAWSHYRNCEYSEEWFIEREAMEFAAPEV